MAVKTPTNTHPVTQILPADNWFAMFTQDEGVPMLYQRLICWALLHDEQGWNYIEGMTGGTEQDELIDNAGESSNFAGYIHWDDMSATQRGERAAACMEKTA